MPSEVVAMAATTVFICPLAVLNAMRVPPRPLKDSAPPLAVGIRAHVVPASAERKMPRPKYESPELSASPPAARITVFVGSALPASMAYNRDLQEDKPPVFDSFDQSAICADVLEGTVRGMSFNRERCAAAASDPALLATDLADYLVSRGVPFREAHHAVGAVVALAERKGCAIPDLSNAEVNRLHPRFGTRWASVFDLDRALSMRKGTGMPGPSQIARQFGRWRKILR